jgi:hypothetical protein
MSGSNTKAESSTESITKDESNSKSAGPLKRFLSRREKGSSDSRQSWFFNFDRKKKKGLEDERKV